MITQEQKELILDEIDKYVLFKKSADYSESYKFDFFLNNKINLSKSNNLLEDWNIIARAAWNLVPYDYKSSLVKWFAERHLDQFKSLLNDLYNKNISLELRISDFESEIYSIILWDESWKTKSLGVLWFWATSFLLACKDPDNYVFINPVKPFNNFLKKIWINEEWFKSQNNWERYVYWNNFIKTELLPILKNKISNAWLLDCQDFIYCSFGDGYSSWSNKSSSNLIEVNINNFKDIDTRWCKFEYLMIGDEKIIEKPNYKLYWSWMKYLIDNYVRVNNDFINNERISFDSEDISWSQRMDWWNRVEEVDGIFYRYKDWNQAQVSQLFEYYKEFASSIVSDLKLFISKWTGTKLEWINYWIYAPWEQAYKWDEYFQSWEMWIWWDKLWDLSLFDNKDELKLKYIEAYWKSENNNELCCFQFANDINIWDIVIAKKGVKKFIWYWIVTSDYFYDNSREEYHSLRKVDWKANWEWSVSDLNDPDIKQAVSKTLTNVTRYKWYWENIVNLINWNSKTLKFLLNLSLLIRLF